MELLKRWANPGLFFVLFLSFLTLKILETSRIQARIIGVEGEDADH